MQTLFSQTASFNATRDDLTAPLPCSRGCVHSPDWLQRPGPRSQSQQSTPPAQHDGCIQQLNSFVHVFICTKGSLLPFSGSPRADRLDMDRLVAIGMPCHEIQRKASSKAQLPVPKWKSCPLKNTDKMWLPASLSFHKLSTREGFPALQPWTQIFCINPATITPNPWKRDDIDMCVSYWVADKPPRQVWHCDPGHSATG